MNLTQAIDIVREQYPNAINQENSVLLLLEDSKHSTTHYRPFYVAAIMMFGEYRRLTEAETVEFEYNLDAIIALLNTQVKLDYGLTIVPPHNALDAIDEVQLTKVSKIAIFTLRHDYNRTHGY